MKVYYDNLNNLELKGVYVIRNLDNELLKIGICKNLKRRFKEIQNNFNFVGQNSNLKIECFIECDNNLEIEKYLHSKFKDYNYKNEWFKIKEISPILDAINKFKIKSSNNKNIRIEYTSDTRRYFYEIRKEKYIICDCESVEDALTKFKKLTSNCLFATTLHRFIKFKPYNNDDNINKSCVVIDGIQYTYEEYENIICEKYFSETKNSLDIILNKINNIDLNNINKKDKQVLRNTKQQLFELASLIKIL